MQIKKILTKAYHDQCPGTSGLRKKTKTFEDNPYYLENYIQSCLSVCSVNKKMPVILGGDGRYYNDIAIQKTIKILLGNGFQNILICQNGILSTPACSHLIRLKKASLGFVFSASHNPGGVLGDVGIKLNVSNGAPASLEITNAIHHESQQISYFLEADILDIDLSEIQVFNDDEAKLSVIDGVGDYVNLMKEIFNFDLIKDYLKKEAVLFDAMHAVTGPYATRILIDELGAATSAVIHAIPKPDFSGKHPDPNPVVAKDLYQKSYSDDCQYALIGASDGDGDRNMILGKGIYINPCDSLAVIADNAALIPYFSEGLTGVARSMPTSRALDLVADQNEIDCYVTPTGWKFFDNLLEAQKIQLCGEESFGTSSSHIREKDGLWAFLCWLNILAAKKQTPAELMDAHFSKYGRYFYCRYDYENLDQITANNLMDRLKTIDITKFNFLGINITEAGQFNYTDPVDQQQSFNQGYQVVFGHAARFVVRLSGTGTSGATLRLYLEVYDQDYHQDLEKALAPLVDIALQFIQVQSLCHKERPDYII